MRAQWSFWAAAALLAAGPAALAADVPYDFVACIHSRQTTLERSADFATYGLETWGTVATSRTKEWEGASTRCVGYVREMGGAPYGKGTCKWFMPAGDTAVGEFEFDHAGAKFTWLAGTGKLKGIQGSGSFQFISQAPAAEPGTSQSCRHDWGSYKIPG